MSAAQRECIEARASALGSAFQEFPADLDGLFEDNRVWDWVRSGKPDETFLARYGAMAEGVQKALLSVGEEKVSLCFCPVEGACGTGTASFSVRRTGEGPVITFGAHSIPPKLTSSRIGVLGTPMAYGFRTGRSGGEEYLAFECRHRIGGREFYVWILWLLDGTSFATKADYREALREQGMAGGYLFDFSSMKMLVVSKRPE